MPSVTVNLTNPTFVSSAQPNNNFSPYPTMYAGIDSQFQICIGLIQITLPSLPVHQVDSAILNLVVISKTGSSPSPVMVNRATSAFITSTVTYNTRPSFTPIGTTVSVSTSSLYTVVQIDVTNLVNGWLNGLVPNNGVALTNPDGQTAVQFATDKIGYAPYLPTLTLTYSSSPMGSSAICFSYAQLANVITQLMQLHPSAVMTFYTAGFNVVGVQGTPVELYASPVAAYGMLAVVMNNGAKAVVPLNQIVSVSLPTGTPYDQSIHYLPVPQFPAGCDKDLITSWHDYLPPETSVTVYAGSLISETGVVYRNEYGLLVIADDNAGVNPVFMPVVNIRCFMSPAHKMEKEDGKPQKTGPLLLKTTECFHIDGGQ